MAEANTSWVHDQFNCPICLDLLNEPVTIPCGHSYCMTCITYCWNQDDQKGVHCPQCRQTFTPRPALNKNVVFAEMVEKLRNTKLQTAQPDLSYAGPGDVECDVCIGRKRKAVKSCLLCQESYCQTHFERHQEFHSGRRHKVTDATRHLKQMICSKHDKQLEIFCRTDQSCICYLCTMDEHRDHDTVAAVVERMEKQRTLEEKQRTFQQSIQEKEKKIQELKEAVKNHKISAQTAVKDTERIFTELIRSIERRQSEVIQMIRDQEKTEVSQGEGHLEKLEKEIEDLRRRNTEMKQLLQTDDHIQFLQKSKSLKPSEYTDKSSISLSSVLLYDDVRKSVSQLKEKLEKFCKEETEKILFGATEIYSTYQNEPKTREDFLQYFFQLSLDQNTAHKHLFLTDNNRVVAHTPMEQPYPDHPDRFKRFHGVLCRESVSERSYWEVMWSGNERQNKVSIAVSYKSISRKGKRTRSGFGFNDQSWGLFCSKSGFSFWHNNMDYNLPVPSSSSRIGVFVDHRAGILSFFSVSDTLTLIHSIQTTFTQPLYPGFWVNPGSGIKLCHL